MCDDPNNADFEQELADYAASKGMSVEELKLEIGERIQRLPCVLAEDALTNFQELVKLMNAIPWDEIRRIAPQVKAARPEDRADWTEMDVLTYLLHRGLSDGENIAEYITNLERLYREE